MRVGFFHLGKWDGRTEIAGRLVASVRKNMPDVEIVQLGSRARLNGVDAVLAMPDGPVALRCLEAYAAAGADDWLFVDTDTEIRADVRHVFEDTEFDIAVAERTGTLTEDELHKGEQRFLAKFGPHNKGAVFSRSSAFWEDAADWLRHQSESKQHWMGDQEAMNATIAGANYRVRVLPNAYNYPPKSKTDDVRDKSILHFKGPRKQWALAGCFA